VRSFLAPERFDFCPSTPLDGALLVVPHQPLGFVGFELSAQNPWIKRLPSVSRLVWCAC